MSKDIKAIEKYLADSGIRLEVTVTISSLIVREHSGVFKEDEILEWAPDDYPLDDAKANWRVMYQKSRYPGQLDSDMDFVPAGPWQLIERKPLIETTVATRLRAHRSLAPLIAEVAKTVEVRPIIEPITDDIPF